MVDLLFYFTPFAAEVWGTVSDWVMVIVTAYTLFYLRKTLKSQLDVQRLQYKSTVIENERYRSEQIPLFDVTTSNTPLKLLNEMYRCTLTIEYLLLNSDIKKCIIKVTSDNAKLLGVSSNMYDYYHLEKNKEFKQDFILTSLIDDYNKYDTGLLIDIELEFTDPVDNIYYQHGHVWINERENRVSMANKPKLKSI